MQFCPPTILLASPLPLDVGFRLTVAPELHSYRLALSSRWGVSLKSLLVKAREEREKAGLKLNIQKTKILAPVPSLYGK